LPVASIDAAARRPAYRRVYSLSEPTKTMRPSSARRAASVRRRISPCWRPRRAVVPRGVARQAILRTS